MGTSASGRRSAHDSGGSVAAEPNGPDHAGACERAKIGGVALVAGIALLYAERSKRHAE